MAPFIADPSSEGQSVPGSYGFQELTVDIAATSKYDNQTNRTRTVKYIIQVTSPNRKVQRMALQQVNASIRNSIDSIALAQFY